MDLIDEGVVLLRPRVLCFVDDAITLVRRLSICSTSNKLSVKKIIDTIEKRFYYPFGGKHSNRQQTKLYAEKTIKRI